MVEAARMFEPFADKPCANNSRDNGNTRRQDNWHFVLPAPKEVGKFKPHPSLGKPSIFWCYRNAKGQLLGFIFRFETGVDEKEFRPLTLWQDSVGVRKWRWKALPEPCPLYGLDRLAARPNSPVLVVEGEKTADAGERIFPEYVAVTSPNGSKAAGKADWAPLEGRRVLVWPDHDQSGTEYAEDVASLAGEAGAVSIQTVNVPPEFSIGWDLAERPPEGWNLERLRGLLDNEHMASAEDAINDPEVRERLLADLAKLGLIEFDQMRKVKAKGLGIRIGTLDKEVGKRRQKDEDDLSGQKVALFEPDPWPDPVTGDALLDELHAAFLRYLVLPSGAAEVLALWTIHAHTFEASHITPRLDIGSPEKGCGKTTLLDVLQQLTPRSIRTESISAAVQFRLMDGHRPTLLVDEVDSFLKQNDELRGALNAGHRRGGMHYRCDGDKHEVRGFKTFGPVALAGIGQLKGTLADRSIRIPMRRRLAEESIRELRADRAPDLKELARKAARWGKDNFDDLCDVDPDVPKGLFNRVADNWRPLFAIADAAGGDWSSKVRAIAVELSSGAGAKDDSVRVQLLADIKAVFEEKDTNRLASAILCEALAQREDAPWIEWGRSQKPITPPALARLLKAFDIAPGTIRLDSSSTPKGYHQKQFDDAFSRYIPSQSATPPQPTDAGAYSLIPKRHKDDDVAARKLLKPLASNACGVVAAETGGNGEMEAIDADMEEFI